MKGRGKEGGRKDRRVQTRRWSKRSSTSLKNAGGGGGVGWGDSGGEGDGGGEYGGWGGGGALIFISQCKGVNRIGKENKNLFFSMYVASENDQRIKRTKIIENM